MEHANDHDTINAVPALLRELERRIDHAFAAYGDLAAALPRARMEARLSGVVGQPIFDRVTNVGASINTARGHVGGAHRLLEKLAGSIGVEVTAAGDERPKPTDPAKEFFTEGSSVVPIEIARTA